MRDASIEIASGTLLVESLNHADQKEFPLTVSTPHAYVEPVGTVFAVSVDPEEKTRVVVTDGEVLVEQREYKSHLFVRSGEYVQAVNGVSEMVRLPIDRGSDPVCRVLDEFQNTEWADRMVMGRLPAQFVRRDPTVYLDIGPGHNPTRLERLMGPCDILTNIQQPQELWDLLHDASYMVKLGIMHQRPEHLDRSLEMIDEVLRTYPDPAYNTELTLWKASLHYALGKPVEALQDLDDALTSQNAGSYKSLILSAMAKIYEQNGDTERAKSFYRKVVQEGSNFPEYELALQRLNAL
jgi:tetratricopeptide (TPR) repeat protein